MSENISELQEYRILFAAIDSKCNKEVLQIQTIRHTVNASLIYEEMKPNHAMFSSLCRLIFIHELLTVEKCSLIYFFSLPQCLFGILCCSTIHFKQNPFHFIFIHLILLQHTFFNWWTGKIFFSLYFCTTFLFRKLKKNIFRMLLHVYGFAIQKSSVIRIVVICIKGQLYTNTYIQ